MRMPLATYWRGVANGVHHGILDRLLLVLLIPFSLPYTLVQLLRAGLYRAGVLKTRQLPRPVISIGNLTVGGTGKTPLTTYIARLLMTQGLKVAVLTRGYGGTREGETLLVSDGGDTVLEPGECGDEPFLLATTVPGLMVVMGADRYAAGLLAMERLAPDVFLLDDGFQHLRLQRDLNILLLDCRRPFANGWTLPAGLLREPYSAARRSDLVIRTRCAPGTTVTPDMLGRPSCNASHHLVDALPLSGGAPIELESLRDRKILAFAGIAEPVSFFEALRSRGLDLVHTMSLPDHAVYDDARISEIMAALEARGAECAITTEKDGVKLKQVSSRLTGKTYLARLDLVIEDPVPLATALRNLLQK